MPKKKGAHGMSQGMWRKQELFGGTRLDQWVEYDAPFILWAARIRDEKVPTELGDATKTELLVSTLEHSDLLEWVGTLASPIADMAGEAVPTDFPSIVKVVKVPSSYAESGNQNATSLERVSAYTPDVEFAPRMKDEAELPDEIRKMAIPTES